MKNLFKQFSDLTGRPLRTVGTCIAADLDECSIQYPGGGLVRAKGAGTVGARYFVLEGRLDGEAPTLGSLDIEV